MMEVLRGKWFSQLGRVCTLLIGLLLIVLIGMWPWPEVQAATVPATVRVGLEMNVSWVDFEVRQGAYQLVDGATKKVIARTLPSGQVWRAQIALNSTKIEVFSLRTGTNWQSWGTFAGPIMLEPINNKNLNLFKHNNRSYRGKLEIRSNKDCNGLICINELPTEEYLYGVVPREMGQDWPLEALKAQAVVARTYVAKNTAKHSADGFGVCNLTHCQVYGGYDSESARSTEAVNATRGEVLVDGNGTLIYALYHSNSGGHTEDNRYVNGWDYSYLRGKPDPYSRGYSLSDWQFATPVTSRGNQGQAGLLELLQKKDSIGPIDSLELIKRESGRVEAVLITDTKGNTIQKTGSEFGQLFNPGFNTYISRDSFMSNFFDLSTDATVAIINGRDEVKTQHGGASRFAVLNASGAVGKLNGSDSGYYLQGATQCIKVAKTPTQIAVFGHGWGHGVGMSQWGAYGMAEQGQCYQQILDFYYPGTKIQ
ncbi:MAG: SpoIID/LytB domain-containing protein [Firmicutes bacterium]|nr:SpoIID/LytB domain-containing protein [Bacillota bacterium]